MSFCPYYNPDYKTCNFFGSTQNESQRESRCLTSSDWKHCENYSNRSYDEKVAKKLRPNPDL